MSIDQRHFPVSQVGDERLRQAIQILTTEHYTLQTGRASTIAESNGRVSVFLAATSSSLIAIAFIGQVSNLGQSFHVFTLLLLPTLLFLGLVTLLRLGQLAGEDGVYIAGINRIRHFYVEIVPEIADYFVLSTHDDWEGRMATMTISWSRWQPLFGAGPMIAVINGVIGGALLGLLATWVLGWPLALSAVVGLVGAILLVSAEFQYGRRMIGRASAGFPYSPRPSRDPSRRTAHAGTRPLKACLDGLIFVTVLTERSPDWPPL